MDTIHTLGAVGAIFANDGPHQTNEVPKGRFMIRELSNYWMLSQFVGLSTISSYHYHAFTGSPSLGNSDIDPDFQKSEESMHQYYVSRNAKNGDSWSLLVKARQYAYHPIQCSWSYTTSSQPHRFELCGKNKQRTTLLMTKVNPK